MKAFRKLAVHVAAITVFFSVFPAYAYAYLDPGTGSYVIQMLVGMIVGGLLTIKIYWRNVRSFFSNLVDKHSKE